MKGKLREMTFRSDQVSLHKGAELASLVWRFPWRCFLDGGLCPEEFVVKVDYLEVVPGSSKRHKWVIGGFDTYLAMRRSFEHSSTFTTNVLIYEDLKREEIESFSLARVLRYFEGATLDVSGIAQLMGMLGDSSTTLDFPVLEETDSERFTRVKGISKYRLESALKDTESTNGDSKDFMDQLLGARK